MFCCKEVIEPSIKLSKMVKLLKIIGFLHYPLIVLDIFLFETNYFIVLFFQLVVLYFSICRKDYGWFVIVIIIYLIFMYELIEGGVRKFLLGINDDSKTLPFCFNIFLLVFEIFCLFLTFQLYKQSKHEMRIKLGFIPNPNEIQQNQMNEEDIIRLYYGHNEEGNNDYNEEGYNNIHDEENNEEVNNDNNIGGVIDNNIGGNNNNNHGEFRPFQGHGVVVGGGDNNQ